MSTSLSPGPSEHPTRQQLDELDALLQRMLALPVNQAGDDVTAEIDAPRPDPAPRQGSVSYRTPDYSEDERPAGDGQAVSAAPRLDAAHVAEDAEANADNWVPLSSTWKPSPHTWKPLAQSWQQPRPSAPAQDPPASREEPVAAAPPPAAVEPPAAPSREEAVPDPPPEPAPTPAAPAPDNAPAGWKWPLVWFNEQFDLLLLPFGTPGRWLRRDGAGRPVFGAAGVLLFAAAVMLGLMGWFGWTWGDLLAKIR